MRSRYVARPSPLPHPHPLFDPHEKLSGDRNLDGLECLFLLARVKVKSLSLSLFLFFFFSSIMMGFFYLVIELSITQMIFNCEVLKPRIVGCGL